MSPDRPHDPMRLTDEQSQLAGDNIDLAYWAARRLALLLAAPWLLEECEDAAVLGLIDAARAFDAARELEFSTLACRCIKNAVVARLKFLRRGKRCPTVATVSLDALDGDLDELGVGPRTADDSPAFEELIAPLSDRHRQVLRWRFRDGLTLERAGRRLGVTRERVRQIELKAMEALANIPAVRRAHDAA
jgi:RNA polymerase sigma factor (sigma-70 family)